MSDADRTTALVDALLAGASEAADEYGEEDENGEEERHERRERRGDENGDRDEDEDDPQRRGVEAVVEIGIGGRTAPAEAIAARGASVVATDVVERSVPEPIEFHVDDVLAPDRSLYADADLLYALRLPPELHEGFARLAGDVGAPAGFTTLGGDPPTVPTRSEQLPGGETIHWVERGREDSDAGVEPSSGDE